MRERWHKLRVPLVVMLAFWMLAAAMWASSGLAIYLGLFGYIGLAVGVGMGLYTTLPKKRKPVGRRLSLLLIGTFLFGFVGVYGRSNLQIEGLFIGLLTGVIEAGVIHYLIAKIVGPLLFGRLWCGWACWTVMVLDLLPYQRSPGRLPTPYGKLRVLHFAISLAVVAALVLGLGMGGDAVSGAPAILWFIGGNVLYYVAAVGLAFALKDNRAFCKYFCPVTVPLKIGTRFSLLKIEGNSGTCIGCRACDRACPMDVRIADYVKENRRVTATECTLCQTCISACPEDVLKMSFGLDAGKDDLLRERE